MYVTDGSVSWLSLEAMSQMVLMDMAYVPSYEDYWSKNLVRTKHST